ESFPRLRGMFAFALWTQSNKRLVLVRDRLGIKPLYVSHRGDNLYFGSEIKTILLHPEIPRTLDEEGLSRYLSLNYVPGERTLVECVRKLTPGHYLEWRAGKTAISAYWRLKFQPGAKSLPEAKEELDHLLRNSVREHMVSDVPLGVWSSGGLDSSTVL